MKRAVGLILAILVCMPLTWAALAADGVFTPSVTAKPAPGIVKNEETGVFQIEVVDSDVRTVASFDAWNVRITAVAEKDEVSVDDTVRRELTEAYRQLSAEDVKLEEVMPALSAAVPDIVPKKLVVKDLFHIGVSDAVQTAMREENRGLKLTMDARIAENQTVVVMVCAEGNWMPVETRVNKDGTITCIFETVGIVAILVLPE